VDHRRRQQLASPASSICRAAAPASSIWPWPPPSGSFQRGRAALTTDVTGSARPPPGISSSTIGTGATFAIGRYNPNSGINFAALVQALRSDGSSNIISTPSLITMNNEEAEVKVTQEIPLITGSYTSSTASP
jgi:general secretion pathway protein D